MTDSDKSTPDLNGSDSLPDAVVEKRRGFSIVWLIPWSRRWSAPGWPTRPWSEQGPTITLTFREGTGLDAGKTKDQIQGP